MVVHLVTMSNLASHVTPTTDTTTDQENVSPVDPVVNVRNDARKAMAMHIDGSTKESKKRARRDRLSDAEKIESVFTSSDCIEALVSLVDDVRFFLESGNASTLIDLKALKYILSVGKLQLNHIQKAIDCTKSKTMAVYVHKKFTKEGRQETPDQKLQRRTLSITNP